MDADQCMNLVLANPNCSHEYFVHAGRSDGNCKCITPGSDCTLKQNQKDHVIVELYSIQKSRHAVDFKVLRKDMDCSDGKWLDPYISQARFCRNLVLSLPQCSKNYFVYAYDDKKCKTCEC